MSHSPNHGHDGGHGEVHPPNTDSADSIDYVKLIVVGVVSLAIFALATIWAARILRRETTQIEESRGKTTVPAEIGKQEIGIVDQVPFEGDKRLDDWKKQVSERLNNYGWVDRGKGIVHIPIEAAMDQVAAGVTPAGAPK
jgi:hypothetical protein